MSEVFTEAVPVPAGELAAFGKLMERTEAMLATQRREHIVHPGGRRERVIS